MTSAAAADKKYKVPPDRVLVDIAEYVDNHEITRAEAYRMARYCLLDALGCAFDALDYPECTKLLGPVVPGIVVPNGARVPGTPYVLDPVTAAFNLGTMIRWTDFNDTFYAADAGHPSDNLGGILATADYLSRVRISEGKPPLPMRDVLTALLKAYEIKGVLSLKNSYTDLGFDHVAFTRVATAAVATKMLGGDRQQIINALSNAWADGLPLKIYRQAPNTGYRKSWAGGDATARGVAHALMARKGEMGYLAVLTAKKFGFQDAYFDGGPFRVEQAYGTFVLEHVMFKFAAAGTYSQTALECAFRLHSQVKDRIADIESITIWTQSKLMGIMYKTGPLRNAADRDHCLQYIVAVGLIYGTIDSASYEDGFAADPRIDALRDKTEVIEDPVYTKAQHDPARFANPNAIEIRFKDGSRIPRTEIEYPIGHFRRREEGLPMLEEKFKSNIAKRFSAAQQPAILQACFDQAALEKMPVNEFVDRLIP